MKQRVEPKPILVKNVSPHKASPRFPYRNLHWRHRTRPHGSRERGKSHTPPNVYRHHQYLSTTLKRKWDMALNHNLLIKKETHSQDGSSIVGYIYISLEKPTKMDNYDGTGDSYGHIEHINIKLNFYYAQGVIKCIVHVSP